MTGPLIVLAIGSVFAGLLNLPAVLPGSGWLHHWLEPVTAASAQFTPEVNIEHATEWVLLGFATIVAITGMVGAWMLLKPEAVKPAAEAPAETGFGKVLFNKWYVDELYDRVVVRPLLWLSELVLWKVVDKGVIDGAGVNGTATVTRFVGWIGSRIQNGRVGTYVLFFVIGVWFVLRAVTG
jgi:NADH-quinone oxidoreductase subunit L